MRELFSSKIETYKVLILIAGTKRTQTKDIQKAQTYLVDFRMRGKKHETISSI